MKKWGCLRKVAEELMSHHRDRMYMAPPKDMREEFRGREQRMKSGGKVRGCGMARGGAVRQCGKDERFLMQITGGKICANGKSWAKTHF